MVYVDEVAIKLDVQVAARLHGAVGAGRGGRGCDASEDGACRKRNKGYGA